MTKGKIYTDHAMFAEAARFFREVEGRTIVFTNGVYDLFHPGHLDSLERAAAEGDILFVATNSDESVRRLKGPERPVLPLDQRLRLLASLRCVRAVTAFDEDTPIELIRAVRPNVLVKGGHYRIQEIVGHEDVLGWGGRVVPVPLLPGYSTTGLIQRIRGDAGSAVPQPNH